MTAATVVEDLLARWQRLGEPSGADPGPWPSLGRRLVAAYQEPVRRYHTVAHLAAVLTMLDELAAAAAPPAVEPAVELAVWFHDAVYNPRQADNEASSAHLATAELRGCGVAEELIATVARLVLATADHRLGSADRALGGDLLLDADLAILAAEPARYDTYRAAVRDEYGHLDDESFRAGRRAVLRSLVDRPRLYLNERAVGRFESAARANLARELAELN